MLIYQNYLILGYDEWNYNLFGLVELPQEFKIRLFILCLINSMCSYIYEKFFIGWFNRYYQRNQKSKMARKQLEYMAALDN